MEQRLSAYVLTHNSERYLRSILEALTQVADEVLVIDSGSTDRTPEIVRSFPDVRLISRPLHSFKDQRLFAERTCRYDWILFLDSDEIPAENFVRVCQEWKRQPPAYEAYTVPRVWYVMGRKVHAFFPIVSPDHPIRLYNRKRGSFATSTAVHETPMGFTRIGQLPIQIFTIPFTAGMR